MDLRECINLEVGLEYKNYQYVVCLATFKRIFFFAAPSDLVMFQWSTYLEKVKNAQDGESDCCCRDSQLRKIIVADFITTSDIHTVSILFSPVCKLYHGMYVPTYLYILLRVSLLVEVTKFGFCWGYKFGKLPLMVFLARGKMCRLFLIEAVIE